MAHKRNHSQTMHMRNKMKVTRGKTGRVGQNFGFVGTGSRNERQAEHAASATHVREKGKRMHKGSGRAKMHTSAIRRSTITSGRNTKPRRGHGYRK